MPHDSDRPPSARGGSGGHPTLPIAPTLALLAALGTAPHAMAAGFSCDALADHCGGTIPMRVAQAVDAACPQGVAPKVARRCAMAKLLELRPQFPSQKCYQLLRRALRLRGRSAASRYPCRTVDRDGTKCRLAKVCDGTTLPASVDQTCLHGCVDFEPTTTTSTTTPPTTSTTIRRPTSTTSTTLVQQPTKFLDPQVGPYGLAWCRYYWGACGQAAADAFCRTKRFSRAIDFARAPDIGGRAPVVTIDDGIICGWNACDGFKHVTCDGEGSRFPEPRLDSGYRLDVCHTWGTGCGWAAAHAFCKTKGYARAAHYIVAPDIGKRDAMQLIGSSEICGHPGCDGFKLVDCVK